MTRNAELAPLLRCPKLSAMLDALPERIALARREQLDYTSFLEVILADDFFRTMASGCTASPLSSLSTSPTDHQQTPRLQLRHHLQSSGVGK